MPYVFALTVLYLLWHYASLKLNPIFFPPPDKVWRAALELFASGDMVTHTAVSFARILAGFLIGSLIAIPLGLLIGFSPLSQRLLGPYIDLLRFIPPITLVIFTIVWFGAGETSKVFLVAFGTVFTVALNVEAGVRWIPRDRIRAAESLGATPTQIFWYVCLPSCIPFVLTGMRVAMGMAFAVITAAELISAEAGLGFLLEISRSFMKTDHIFVAVLALGTLGLLTDRAFKVLIQRFGGEYVR